MRGRANDRSGVRVVRDSGRWHCCDETGIGDTKMLSIQCDDTTAAAIIIDDANEIAMAEEDWEIAGRPTIGDTISFEVLGDGMFVDAFNGMCYLVTDEYEHNGNHIVSFTEVSQGAPAPTEGTWDASEDIYGDAEVVEYATDDGDDGDIDALQFFPGIIAPEDGADTTTYDKTTTPRPMTIKNMPSMKLLSVLVQEHGMSVHDIAAGLIAFEKESAVPAANEDVIVDFFKQNSDDIKDISEDFVAYSHRVTGDEPEDDAKNEPESTQSLTIR